MVINLINNFEQIYYEKTPRETKNKGINLKTKNTNATSTIFK